MINIKFIIVIVLCNFFELQANFNDVKNKPNKMSFEIGGAGGFYSYNYSRYIKYRSSLGIGFSTFPGIYESYTIIILPIYYNFHITLKNLLSIQSGITLSTPSNITSFNWYFPFFLRQEVQVTEMISGDIGIGIANFVREYELWFLLSIGYRY